MQVSESKKHLVEFLGTFVFSLGVNLSSTFIRKQNPETNTEEVSPVANIFLILVTLFSAITITRKVSGGLLNPALSITFLYDKGILRVLAYSLFQILGAFCGALLSFIIYGGNILPFWGAPDSYYYEIILAEFIGTFIFAFNTILQHDTDYTKNESISTLLIVLGLFAGASFAASVSGGCLNPALLIGHSFTRALIYGSAKELKVFIWFLIGQLLAGYGAGMLFNNYYREKTSKRSAV